MKELELRVDDASNRRILKGKILVKRLSYASMEKIDAKR